MKKSTTAAVLSLAVGLASVPALAEPMVYVGAGSANKILVIDAGNDKVVGEFDGVANVHALVATPDGEYVIAGSLKEVRKPDNPKAPPESTIYIVHPEHGHVMSTIPATGMIHHQAITPDGRYVLSTHSTRGGISYTDLTGEGGVKTLKTGPGPYYVIVTKDGKRAYVSNSGNGTISEIDTSEWRVTRTLKAGPSPQHLVFSKDEKIIYVANARAGKVSAVSRAQGNVTGSYEIGAGVHGLDISDDGRTLFVTSKKDNRLVVLNPDLDTRKVVMLSPSPYHLETIHGTGKVYVSSSKQPKIWVIDQKTAELKGEIQIQGEGHQMAVVNR